jgi:hypothetical protein
MLRHEHHRPDAKTSRVAQVHVSFRIRDRVGARRNSDHIVGADLSLHRELSIEPKIPISRLDTLAHSESETIHFAQRRYRGLNVSFRGWKPLSLVVEDFEYARIYQITDGRSAGDAFRLLQITCPQLVCDR